MSPDPLTLAAAEQARNVAVQMMPSAAAVWSWWVRLDSIWPWSICSRP